MTARTPGASQWNPWRAAAAAGVLAAAIVVPFLLAGPAIEEASVRELTAARGPAFAFLVVLLLAADIVLPIPSSVIATLSGAALGPWLGTAASAAGLSLGAIGAFFTVRAAGGPLARRMMGDAQYERLAELAERNGPWLIAVFRPVPVLSEASVIAVAAGRGPIAGSILAIAGSSTATAALYAVLGAEAERQDSAALLIVAAVLPPLLAWPLARWGLWRQAGR